MLAVAFGPPTMAEACAGCRAFASAADCVELRLDLFEEPFDLEVLLRERGSLPVVVTLRPPEQGGDARCPPDERLEVLLQAAELGAEYVDLEWDAASAAGAGGSARGGRTRDRLAPRFFDDAAGSGRRVVARAGGAGRGRGESRRARRSDVRDCLPVFRALSTAPIGRRSPSRWVRPGCRRACWRCAPEQCLLTYAALGRRDGDRARAADGR